MKGCVLSSHNIITFNVQMSGWQEVRRTAKDDWKSITTVLGEQFAMITLTTLMLALSAIVSDLG